MLVGNRIQTRSSAIADGPCDAMCQSKSCQLLRCSVGTSCTRNPEQIEAMDLEGYSQATCNTFCAHSTVVGVMHKRDRREFCSPQHRLAVGKFSTSRVWGKVPAVPLLLEIPEFPYNTAWDRWVEASVPKSSSVHILVSIQYNAGL